MRVGVFDSGLGGLAILRKFFEVLPRYDYIYLADNAHVPYGNKSAELIYQYTKQAVSFLFKKDCVLIILACNAATTNALRRLQREYLRQTYPERRILGVVKPVVEEAAKDNTKKIGVIGTHATIATQSFVKELKKLNWGVQVFQQACPLLVPIIEEGELDWEGLDLLLDKYLSPIKNRGVESIILACTHYELIDSKIQKYFGGNIKVIPEGEITARKLVDYLVRHPEIEKTLQKSGQRAYFVTDQSRHFKKMTQLFLGNLWRDTDELKLCSLEAS